MQYFLVGSNVLHKKGGKSFFCFETFFRTGSNSEPKRNREKEKGSRTTTIFVHFLEHCPIQVSAVFTFYNKRSTIVHRPPFPQPCFSALLRHFFFENFCLLRDFSRPNEDIFTQHFMTRLLY